MNVSIDLAKEHLKHNPENIEIIRADLNKVIAAYEKLEKSFENHNPQRKILQKYTKTKKTEHFLIDLQINCQGLIFFTNYSLIDIDVKSNITNLLASNQIIIECLDIKHPGFKEMIQYEYEKIISEWNIKLKIEKE